jgi:signal transduction histidine kinase
LSHDLRPTVLDDLGLVAALEWLVDEYERVHQGAVYCEAKLEQGGPLPSEVQVALFRIAQEGLSNCGKHAAAEHVRLSLSIDGGQIMLTMEDDGQGFDVDRMSRPTRDGHLGLYGMRERAALLGGTLEVASGHDSGTRISVLIPLKPAEDAALTPLLAEIGRAEWPAPTAG